MENLKGELRERKEAMVQTEFTVARIPPHLLYSLCQYSNYTTPPDTYEIRISYHSFINDMSRLNDYSETYTLSLPAHI
jgi:NADPH-dependent 7-cyano-7-deazaguanine reductase QueF